VEAANASDARHRLRRHEKAIALTIPQFAAAAAHYRTADPLAPRLILLDEAFVRYRLSRCGPSAWGSYARSTSNFVMTSEQEWGCYASVPGHRDLPLVRTARGNRTVGVTPRGCEMVGVPHP